MGRDLGAVAAPATPALEEDRRGRLIVVSTACGLLVAVLWSFELVDRRIGDNVANSLLGYDARGTAIAGSVVGGLFAFVTGLAGTFTACNVAAFGAMAGMAGGSADGRARGVLRPLGWVAVGLVAVSATYGAVGAAIGERLPQLSTAQTAAGMPVRLVQSVAVFGVIGLAFVYLGLAAVGAVPDLLSPLRARFPDVDAVVIGALVGAFLIGRPFGLFIKMFHYAAEQGDPLYGAATFVLQGVGNIVVVTLLLLALTYGGGGRLRTWLASSPGRVDRLTAVAFLVAGSFTFFYWVVRVPSLFGYGWFPRVPWN